MAEVQKYLVYFKTLPIPTRRLGYQERYEQAINEPGIVINISTRRTVCPDDVIDYLAELTERIHVTVELGFTQAA